MTVLLYILFGLGLVYVAFEIRVWYIQPLTFKKLSAQELKEHLKRCGVILLDGGRIVLTPNYSRAPVQIRKKVYKTRADTLELRLTAGDHTRERLGMLYEHIKEQEYDLKITRTSKLKKIKHLYIRFPAQNVFMPQMIVNLLEEFAQVYEFNQEPRFKLQVYGPFELEPLPDLPEANAGRIIGYMVGRMVRIVRNVFSGKE